MSVPSDQLVELMAGGGGASAAPGPNPMAAAAGGNQPPAGGPMTTPQPKDGLIQAAMGNITLTFKMLEQALTAFGAQTEEGKAILSALKTLTSKFGEDRSKSDQLIPAELQQLVQSAGGGPVAQAMPPAGGATPPMQ